MRDSGRHLAPLSSPTSFFGLTVGIATRIITMLILQVDCHIWKKKCERVAPENKGVEYAYQMRYWKKLPKAKKKIITPDVPLATEDVRMQHRLADFIDAYYEVGNLELWPKIKFLTLINITRGPPDPDR